MTEEELPPGWAWATLGELGEWGAGGTPRTNVSSYYGGEIRWAKSGDLNDGLLTSTEETITREGLDNSSAKLVEPGTLLIAMYGATIGVVSVLGIRCATNQAVAHVVPNSEATHVWFLFWLVRAARAALRNLGQGGAQPNLSQTILKNYPVALPPLAEQRRIVNRIEALLDEVEAGEAALARAREALTQFRASLLHAAVTGQLTEAWRAANPPTEDGPALLRSITARRIANGERVIPGAGQPAEALPLLPRGWTWCSLGDLGQISSGTTPARSRESFWLNGSIPWLTSAAVNERRISVARQFVTAEALRVTSLKIYPAGTIVVALYGEGTTRGKAAVIELDAATNQALAALQTSALHPTTRRYILLNLEAAYLILRSAAMGGVQPNLTLGILKSWRIALPPLAEQERIVEVMGEVLANCDADEAVVASAQNAAATLRQSILHAAFTGRLVPQDPNDKPAEALLARLRETTTTLRRTRRRAPETSPA